eukprot:9473381-Pyramimonas_sp.AAC.1
MMHPIHACWCARSKLTRPSLAQATGAGHAEPPPGAGQIERGVPLSKLSACMMGVLSTAAQ